MRSGSMVLRPAFSDDLTLVKKTLYTALSWDPNDPIPPFEVAVDHPKIAIYHDGWMRPGDDGVVAEGDGALVGMAFCRLFPDGEDAQGFVDANTPELAVGVEAEFRGLGVGRCLIERLHGSRLTAGVKRMSLSVNAGNRAVHLYQRIGYIEVRRHGDGIVMLANLSDRR